MRTAIRSNPKRKFVSLRELREHYLEQGKIMSGPFKNIDITYKTDQHGGYYNAVDFAGRAWKITNFSLSGIWVLWPPNNSQHKTIYVQSLYDADVILGGGVVREHEINKPQRVNVSKKDTVYYEKYADYQIDQAKQEIEKRQFEQRKSRRNSVPGQIKIR